MGGLYRLVLLLALLGSAGLTIRSVAAISANPALTPLIERASDEIAAVTDRMIAAEATPERLAALLADRLDEDPRNWIALQALADLYAERSLPLPQGYTEAWDADSSLLSQAGKCAACLWDITSCSLSTALLCKAPILLTPLEDMRGLAKAGYDNMTGAKVDRLDLGLSVVGLAATGLVVASGGSSMTVKAGAGLVRLARGMGRLTPGMARMMAQALTDGIHWVDLPAARGTDDLAALVRTDAVAPLLSTLSDLGRTEALLGPAQTLHLLPLIDSAADARNLARVTDALGPRTVSRVEVLGKSRLFRAALRVSDTAVELIIGLAGLVVALGAALANLIQTALIRALRQRRPGRPA